MPGAGHAPFITHERAFEQHARNALSELIA
jgi:hypothetical protein